ncbi:MAG: hypothetical protein EBU31_00490 [Proteobacteria bacterium]|nr:hypothetical protein [Pseudomonadota bacterium]
MTVEVITQTGSLTVIDETSTELVLTTQAVELSLSVGQGPSGPPGDGASIEDVQDFVGQAIAAGTGDGVTLTYDDAANAIGAINTDKGSEAVSAHLAAADPHPVYASDAQAQQYAFDAVYAHEQAADPHPGYLDMAEGDARYAQFAFATVGVSGQGDVVADGTSDRLTLQAGTNIIIETFPATDTIRITSTAQAAQAQSIAVQDEGTLLTASATSLNFVGAGVTATATGGAVSVSIPAVSVLDEGSSIAAVLGSINFVGAGVTATATGNAVTVTVPTFNAFGIVTGNTGTANADSTNDSLAITGTNGITTAATDTPDGVVIEPVYGMVRDLAPDVVNDQGVANTVARSDHSHAVPCGPAVGLSAATTNTEGVTAEFARADHTHAISTGTPGAVSVTAASPGTSANLARADHNHSVSTGKAVALGAAAAEGTATSLARSDHVHPYPTAAQVGAASLAFSTVAVAGQANVVAGSTADTLTLVAGTNITLITNAANESITINSTGGGGGTSYTGDLAFLALGGY